MHDVRQAEIGATLVSQRTSATRKEFSRLERGSTFSRGRRAEERVSSYLRGKGWQILAKNYSLRTCEADIIALDGTTLVAVEVKSVANASWGLENISRQVNECKIAKVQRALVSFSLTLNPRVYDSMRVDVVAMYSSRMVHYKNIG